MPPKQGKSALGPLAGRTLKGPSVSAGSTTGGSGSGSGGSRGSGPTSSPKRSDPTSPSRNIKLSSSSLRLQEETIHVSPPAPYLLPREEETSSHRTLRRLLRDVVRHRDDWEEEVIETAEFVARYCTALGEVEDELGSSTSRKRRRTRRQNEESGSESEDSENELQPPKKQSSTSLCNAHNPTLISALRDLDETYHLLEKGRTRILKQEDLLIKVKDELRKLQWDWKIRGNSNVVSWGQRDGDEFVEAATSLILQVQLQTSQLISSLDEMYITCSPIGSLHSAVVNNHNKPYHVTSASSRRKDILLLWRDLPLVERGGGSMGFNWWRRVWEKEVGRWNNL